MSLSRLLCALISILTLSGAVLIDNGVIDIPHVTCEDNQVTMVFNTQRPFTGRIFVKEMSKSRDCAMSYRGNTGSSVQFQLKSSFGCNMRRQRKVGPQRGVEQSMVVVISFHDTFITKVDRAYRCTCFFMEADKVVTSEIGVSALPTTDLYDTARQPACTYYVRRDSITGPVVNYAKVGEVVYHVWQCDGDMFGMLIHSCFVDDGSGNNRFQISDQDGCSADSVVLGELSYNHLVNQAFVEGQVFKFADKISVYFQCSVSLCMKNDGACGGVTPPNCNRTRNRVRKDVGKQLAQANRALISADNTFDLGSEKIYVLDLDDANSDEPVANELVPQPKTLSPVPNSIGVKPEICVSAYSFAAMFTTFVVIISVAFVAATYLYLKYRNVRLNK